MELKLEAKNRTELGKKVKTLRDNGFIPGEIYGRDFENTHVSVNEKEFIKIYKNAGENTIINLKTEKEEVPVLISSVLFHHITEKPLTIDFHKIRMDEKVKIDIPIVITGEDKTKENDYNLIHTLNEVEIEALPGNIPHEFKIDISALKEIGQSISVRDITIPNGVEILTSPETVIIIVAEKQKEKEEKPEEEVIEDVKKEDEEKTEEKPKEKK